MLLATTAASEYTRAMSEIQNAVELAIEKHGGLRKAARALNIEVSYFWRLRHGDKSNPSDKVLRKLGLAREIEYRRIV